MQKGKIIKNAIRGAGITLDTAAAMLNISRQTLFNKLNQSDPGNEFVNNVKDKFKSHFDIDSLFKLHVGHDEYKLSDFEKIYKDQLAARDAQIEANNKTIESNEKLIKLLEDQIELLKLNQRPEKHIKARSA